MPVVYPEREGIAKQSRHATGCRETTTMLQSSVMGTHWRSRSFAVAMSLLALLGVVGCASDAAVQQQAEDMHAQLEPAIVTDADVAQYVQAVGERVVQSAYEEYQAGLLSKRINEEDPTWMFNDVQFHLVNSDTLNAFTTGGKHVYLYSELFESSQTEDEFAAVVAHEFGHIYGRHVHNSMNNQYGIIGAAVGAGVLGYALGGDDREQIAMLAGGGALMAGQLWGLGYSRDQESEADDLGFTFYVNSGWDPSKFPDFFKQMIAKGYETPKEQEMMASHPRLSDRVRNIEKKLAQLPPGSERMRKPNLVSQSRFDKLKRRAQVVGAQMPNDKSLEAARLMLASFPSCVAPVAQESQTEAREKIARMVNEQKGK
jgi:predicted Zn-dependent protease